MNYELCFTALKILRADLIYGQGQIIVIILSKLKAIGTSLESI